jgi:ferritin-like metal-binding protein YciE
MTAAMKAKDLPIESLQELLGRELQEIYSAEVQVRRALPRMAQLASTPLLKDALEDRLSGTEEQVFRLEQALAELGRPARGKYCLGMDGLIAEARELLDQSGAEAIRDAWLVAANRRMVHYEMAAYQTVATHAQLVGVESVAALLDRSLEEERAMDERLASLAQSASDAVALQFDPDVYPLRSGVRRPALREELL